MNQTYTHTCQELGLCQFREPACAGCTNFDHVPLRAPEPEPAPATGGLRALLRNSWPYAATLGGVCFLLGFMQADDAHWREVEQVSAQQRSYHAGYHQGSSAALKALHLRCIDRSYLAPIGLETMAQVQRQVCDKALAMVKVPSAAGVQ